MLSPYSGTWLDNVTYSSRRVLQGFGLAALVAIPLGLMIGWSRLAARVIDPTVQLLRPVPITAWLPFAIAVFGIYDASALFLIGLGAFYPIVVNTTHGVRDTNLLLLRAARMLGAGTLTVLAKVVFPSALPSIFTGLRLGIGVAWTAVIVAEMIAGEVWPGLRAMGRLLRRPHGHLRCDDVLGRTARLHLRSDHRLERAPSCCAGARSRPTHDRDRRRLEEFVKGERRVLALRTSTSASPRASSSRSWGPPDAASRPCSTWWRGSTVRRAGRCEWTARDRRALAPPRRGVPGAGAVSVVRGHGKRVVRPQDARRPAAEYRPRAAQILEQVGLRGFEDQLSGGALRWHAPARRDRACAHHGAAGAADGRAVRQPRRADPFVDAGVVASVWERHHQTVLFVTHDIEEALLLADRVCVMTARPGRIKKSIDVTDSASARHRGDNVAGVQRAAPCRCSRSSARKVSRQRWSRRAAERKSDIPGRGGHRSSRPSAGLGVLAARARNPPQRITSDFTVSIDGDVAQRENADQPLAAIEHR